jgi:hypothetical protein
MVLTATRGSLSNILNWAEAEVELGWRVIGPSIMDLSLCTWTLGPVSRRHLPNSDVVRSPQTGGTAVRVGTLCESFLPRLNYE